ncbi:hypothetical protein [Haloechinothrix salitolerans]|uniref:ARB-07466-like C-terminal domain-containing protein n=1 Tax=Haloechinothrix salitolerans TaxID=926830 RepID=A0ABW2C6Z6_9PSEU
MKPLVIGTIATALLGATFWLVSSLGTGAEDPAITAATFHGPSIALPTPTTTTSTTPSTRATTTTKRRTSPSSTPMPQAQPKPTPTRTHPPTTRPKPSTSCSATLDGTQRHVARVGHHLLGRFDVDSVIGRAERSGTSDHPDGLALDFMVSTSTGDALADYVIDNQARFGVTYVIWRQRYNDGGGWSYMTDRGNTTANHYDHVHVSFRPGVDVDVTC